MSKRAGFNEHIQKKQVIQAVVICDDYSNSLGPIIFSKPSSLIPLVNRPFLDYTLNFLAYSEVEEVILFSSSHSHLVKKYIKQSKWNKEFSPMSLSLVMSETCRSMGDAMRVLYAKGVLRGDFILLYGTTVGNVPLVPFLEKFQEFQRRDKGAVIAMLLQDAGYGYKAHAEDMVIATYRPTNQVLSHQKLHPQSKKINFLSKNTLVNGEVDILTDLRDTGVWFCSATVPSLFEDNFDYECVDDLIKGILMDDEIMQYSVYWFPVSKDNYVASVLRGGWLAFQAISYDVINRRTFPIVPDNADYLEDEKPYVCLSNNIYLQGSTSSSGCDLAKNVVVGSDSAFGTDSVISQSVIGRNCKIGQNVTLSDSFLWENVVVGDNCKIEGCVLAEGCHVGADVNLPSGCVLGPGVRIEKGEQIIKHVRLVAEPYLKYNQNIGTWKQISQHAWIVPKLGDDDDSDDESEQPTIGRLPTSHDEDVDESKEDLPETIPPSDDATLFYTEVLDSLARGFEDRLPTENLCLEINSSRYAYNMAADDVPWHVVRAILNLPEHLAVKNPSTAPYLVRLSPPLSYLKPVLANYIRNAKGMKTCLQAIEDVAGSDEYLPPCLNKLLHILYDKDILDEQSILTWYNSPADPESTIAQDLRKKVVPLINWLIEADEESSEE